jgi:hypothetical protein
MNATATKRNLPRRLWAAIGGVAAAVVLVGLVGSSTPASRRIVGEPSGPSVSMATADDNARFAAMWPQGEWIVPQPVLGQEYGNITGDSSPVGFISDEVFDVVSR